MHIEFLVEEPSAAEALGNLLPKMIEDDSTFDIHIHQGKHDLLKKLPGRLQGYGRWIPSDWRVVVMVDEDREDCIALKQRLEDAAINAGMQTKSRPNGEGLFQVLNRIVIEELEAWFFGDVEAMNWAYPRVPLTLARKARFRDSDHIAGGTWEALERVLQRAGYFPSGMPRIEVARSISSHMNPLRNRSKSFQIFQRGLQAL